MQNKSADQTPEATKADTPSAADAGERRGLQVVDAHKLKSPGNFLNREISQLEFNYRVLHQALDERIPLLERLRFLCISCTNLDEFFEVRVAVIRQLEQHSSGAATADGLSPRQILNRTRSRTLDLVEDQYQCFNQVLLPALGQAGIHFLAREYWSASQKRWLREYFRDEILPILSPLGLDPVHPFPRILNKSLNFAVQLEGKDAFGRESHFALVRAPRSLSRVIRIPAAGSAHRYEFVFLSSILHEFMSDLFPGMTVIGSHQFRVTRNSELFVDEEAIEDLARALQGELMERGFAEAVRLEIATGCPDDVVRFLSAKFGLSDDDVYRCDGPVNLNRIQEIYSQVDRDDLKYPAFKSAINPLLGSGANLFESMRTQDFLLHHPYDNFSMVVELLHQAATDPDVLAIKQTLYRTGVDSVVVGKLIEAARAGKDVTVVVELRARFDEAANIGLATRLQEAGVQVVYGVVGHKTHAKLLMVVRREAEGLVRYLHLGTGNYHPDTAGVYTDFSLLTSRRAFGEDVHNVFQELSGLGKVIKMQKLLHSPFTLGKQVIKKIRREARHAAAGKEARIDAKMNSLTDAGVIRELYKASQAGVQIRLVIRGTCCLLPGIPGLSDNIEVRSILGRFLEHSRVYYFHNDGKTEVWCASADWMERNLHQRVEVAFPILDDALADQVCHEALSLPLSDDIQHWRMQSDGSYQAVTEADGQDLRHLHDLLIKRAAKS